MDVSIASRAADLYAQSKPVEVKKTDADAATVAQNAATEVNVGDAYSVDLSDAGKKIQQAAQENDSVDDAAAQSTKGLSADQVRALQNDIAVSQQTMLNMMMQAVNDQNGRVQGWLDEGVEFLNFDGVQIDPSKFALPEVAKTPEDAAKAVADGGEWSVDAVSNRIFDLANAIAGGDPERLSQMRSAVEEGFKQAGITWTNATGLQDMPEITGKTYDAVMKLFDDKANELSGASAVE